MAKYHSASPWRPICAASGIPSPGASGTSSPATEGTAARPPFPGRRRRPLDKASEGERGFSLIEQIVAAGLVAVVVPALALLLSGLVRQASSSGAEVAMLTLARSQLESIKGQTYQSLPATYAIISPVPPDYSVNVASELVKSYSYPPPGSASLPDEIQLITVEVRCVDCSPPVGSLILQDYKVKR